WPLYLLFVFFFLTLPLLISTLFPYTTLFRSSRFSRRDRDCPRNLRAAAGNTRPRRCFCREARRGDPKSNMPASRRRRRPRRERRSEEHTSELQSRENLVCRLLLEKKKTSYII